MKEHCPNCESSRINFMIIRGKGGYHCYECNSDFNKPILKASKINETSTNKENIEVQPIITEEIIKRFQVDFLTSKDLDSLIELRGRIKEVSVGKSFRENELRYKIDILLHFLEKEISILKK